MTYKGVLDDGKDRFEKTLAHLKDQLRRIRTGRATTALVDNVRVDYYGTPTPVNQLAAAATAPAITKHATSTMDRARAHRRIIRRSTSTSAAAFSPRS